MNDSFFVVVTNLPFRVRWQTLKDVARDATPNIDHVEIYQHLDGRSKGQGYIRVRSEEDAALLIERLNLTVLDERQLWAGLGEQKLDDRGRLTVAAVPQYREIPRPAPVEREAFVPPTYETIPPPAYGVFVPPPDYGNQFTANQHAGGFIATESRGIFISGLPYEANLEELRRQFGTVGFIEHIEAPMQGRGRLKGWAAVRYSSIDEAERAIAEFNNTELGRRRITVRRDVVHTPREPPFAQNWRN